MNNPFQKASRKKAKLRAALFGPSGSGKTFTALRISTGLGGKIAVIDTERKSASKYADMTPADAKERGLLKPFEFDALELTDKTIAGYVKSIKAAGENDYEVLIIDSLSHGWQELLERVEKLAQAKYRGNTWSAWSEGTPEQRELVDAILDFPGHVIATMRSKTEWTTAKQDNGKSAPVRVGLAPEQGKGIEYEFDLLLELTVDHVCNVLKDRTGKFQDQLIDKPGEDFGKSLADWLDQGAVVVAPIKSDTTPVITDDQAKAGNINKFRAMLETNRGPHALPAFEELYCGKASATFEDNKLRTSFDEFTLAELRLLWPKRAAVISATLEAIPK